MRVAPSFSRSSTLADFIVTDGTTSGAPSSFNSDLQGPKTSSLSVTYPGLAIGRASRTFRNGSPSGSFIQFSSEL